MSLDDVASCGLFFICQYVLACVLLPAEVLNVCKICPGFCISSGDQQWKANHRDVASISKTRVLLPAHKQHACCVVRSYDSTYVRGQKSVRTYKAFIRNIPHTELLHVFSNTSSMYVELYKHVGGPF